METRLLDAFSSLLYTGAFAALMACITVAGLAARKLRGRGWLLAWALVKLVELLSSRVFNLLFTSGVIDRSFGGGFYSAVSAFWGWLSAVSLACLAFFMLSQCEFGGRPLDVRSLLFSFRGRVSRLPYWVGVFALVSVTWVNASSVVGVLARESFRYGSSGVQQLSLGLVVGLHVLWALATAYLLLAIQAKRWHDRGKSAWMILINAIPLVGPVWALVELGFLRGTPGPNAYGEDPLAPDALPREENPYAGDLQGSARREAADGW